jgi:hypothetical protein
VFLLTSFKRARASAKLDRLDAEVARVYVYDGQLSLNPLGGGPTEWSLSLRKRRLAIVAELERHGGRDPHPVFLREPTALQRAHHKRSA